MRDQGWNIIAIGVGRANQFDLMEIGGDPGNAFYIEKEHSHRLIRLYKFSNWFFKDFGKVEDNIQYYAAKDQYNNR